MSDVLTAVGWDAEREHELSTTFPALAPARVSAEHRGSYELLTADGPTAAATTGRMRHAQDPAELPAVGDWVAFERLPTQEAGLIHGVLSRRSRFARQVAGRRSAEQVLAANIDIVGIVSAMTEDFNTRRIERYLTLAWESGAVPLVILTKSDLQPDLADRIAEATAVAPGVDVVPVSALTGEGMEAIREHLAGNPTIAFLGSSGVGKSTLINALLGDEVMATKETRWDGRGRHTTTIRRLLPLPGGGALIDTPGMRELQLWHARDGIEDAFSDIAELAAACRFNDCSHTHEPGCAVQEALSTGELLGERFESYRKQLKELAALRRRTDKRLMSEESKKWRKLYKEASARARPR